MIPQQLSKHFKALPLLAYEGWEKLITNRHCDKEKGGRKWATVIAAHQIVGNFRSKLDFPLWIGSLSQTQ